MSIQWLLITAVNAEPGHTAFPNAAFSGPLKHGLLRALFNSMPSSPNSRAWKNTAQVGWTSRKNHEPGRNRPLTSPFLELMTPLVNRWNGRYHATWDSAKLRDASLMSTSGSETTTCDVWYMRARSCWSVGRTMRLQWRFSSMIVRIA